MILTLSLTSDSRWIVFSDCHRGAGIEITARSSAGGSLLPHFALIKWAIRPAEEKGVAAGSTLTIARTVLEEGI